MSSKSFLKLPLAILLAFSILSAPIRVSAKSHPHRQAVASHIVKTKHGYRNVYSKQLKRLFARQNRQAKRSEHQHLRWLTDRHTLIRTHRQIYANEIACDRQTLRDINSDRHSKNLAPLKLSKSIVLNGVARQRSRQIIKRFSHYTHRGGIYAFSDAKAIARRSHAKDRIDRSNFGENIATSHDTRYFTHQRIYSENGATAANDINTNLWTKEKGTTPSQDGGHRQNIENPEFKSVSISTTYDPHSQTYNLAEEFMI